jgi:hypothetical protein
MNDNDGSGWVAFASAILIFTGIMRFFDSIWAFRYKGALPDGLQNATLGHNIKTYAWVYLIIGIILVLVGIGVVYRSQFSRWFGVVAAGLGGLSAMPWMPYFPVWTLIYIVLAITVMYALIAHGARETAPGV